MQDRQRLSDLDKPGDHRRDSAIRHWRHPTDLEVICITSALWRGPRTFGAAATGRRQSQVTTNSSAPEQALLPGDRARLCRMGFRHTKRFGIAIAVASLPAPAP